MAEDKPRLARLTAIITQLQSKKIVTANDIAKKHQVSIRTAYRDIKTLEKSGIPIITEEGKGYSIVAGYHLPPIMFTEDEAMALITAEQIIVKNKDKSLAKTYTSAIIKIKAVLKTSQLENTELISQRIQVRNNPLDKTTSHFLIQIQSHITKYQVILIDYVSVHNHSSTREVEPFALYTTQDNWILIAYCRDKQDYRAFRLDRIQSLIVTDKVFEPHSLTLEQYLEQCRKKWQDTPDIPLSQGPSTFE